MLRLLLALTLLAAVSAEGAGAACSRSVAPDGKPRFRAAGGEVTDVVTGLVWRRCSVGHAWKEGEGCTGERAAIDHAEALAAAAEAGRPWRLPTARELASLIDRECGRPAIDTRYFPDVSDSSDEGVEEFWTTTPGGIEEMIVFVEFADGYTDIRSPGFQRSARLVRPGR